MPLNAEVMPTETACPRASLEAALLAAIWQAWHQGDQATTEDLAATLRTSRSQATSAM